MANVRIVAAAPLSVYPGHTVRMRNMPAIVVERLSARFSCSGKAGGKSREKSERKQGARQDQRPTNGHVVCLSAIYCMSERPIL